jgi:ectoine hydroxylase-related dioxygenase (phytanoyl-CoA dioxygenase family)
MPATGYQISPSDPLEPNATAAMFGMKTSTCVGDVELRVVELTGDPGDVILMHPVMMHAGSVNCSSSPRLVLSTTVYKRGVDWNALYAPERRVAVQ